MNKTYLFFPKIIIGTSLLSLLTLPIYAQELNNINELELSPDSLILAEDDSNSDFSGTGGDSTTGTSGGGRNDCPSVDLAITALIPQNSDFHVTTEANPTLWFYVPYSSEETPIGEFVLQDENRNDIFRSDFTLPENRGFVSFTIPDNEKALILEQNYRWYFQLYCDAQKESTPLFVQGWVKRIAEDDSINHEINLTTPINDVFNAAKKDWYSVVNDLVNIRSNNLTDEVFNQTWIDFWKTILKTENPNDIYFLESNIELFGEQEILDSVIINNDNSSGLLEPITN